MRSMVVVVVPIGVVRGLQVDMSVSSKNANTTKRVIDPRTAGRRRSGNGSSPHPDSK